MTRAWEDVVCPTCNASIDERCHRVGETSWPMEFHHAARRHLSESPPAWPSWLREVEDDRWSITDRD